MISASTALTHEGTATLTIGDTDEDLTAGDLARLRSAVMNRVRTTARNEKTPVQLETQDPDGKRWVIVIHPDGRVEDRTKDAAVNEAPPAETEANGDDSKAGPKDDSPRDDPPRLRKRERVTAALARSSAAQEKPAPAESRPAPPTSFLTSVIDEEPAREGWRGRLNTLGLRLAPSAAERELRSAISAVSQHWPGPRRIAVINGKGGSGKTPTTAYLAAALARHGGGGVLAWDCNITRGTLGWCTEQGPHESTALELLPHADELLSAGAQAASLAAFVHHQTRDRYDVLRSNPLLLSTEQKLTPAQFDQIHDVAAKYYRLILMDSGNDEGDELWLSIVSHADQIVVPTSTREEHAEAARLCIEALRDRGGHYAELAESAVVIVSQADKDREEATAEAIADGFRSLVPSVVTIPYDRAIRRRWKRWELLARPTQEAFLRAAGAVARSL